MANLDTSSIVIITTTTTTITINTTSSIIRASIDIDSVGQMACIDTEGHM